MNNALKRTILRWAHLIMCIPILSYIYGKPADVQMYADAVRYIFVPIIFLSGFWMYAGMIFAVLGVAFWIAGIHFGGLWPAIGSQASLFIARRIWLAVRARQPQPPTVALP